jgi:hypothetical protein
MSSNPEPSYVPHDTFAQSHLSITPARQMCTCIRNRSLRQSKPVVISHRLFKQEQGSWPCASLQTAWCLNLKSMRKLEIFSFLHWNKSLLYTVPFCKSPKASFICLVQQLEAPEFPREISAFITSRKVLLCVWINHHVPKFDSWPEPVKLQGFLRAFSKHTPVCRSRFNSQNSL